MNLRAALGGLVVLLAMNGATPLQAAGLPRLRVSDNHRFLVAEDGTPFFYLSDTAWGLFQRLDKAETEKYLQDRARKRFTVVKAAVSLWWIPKNTAGEAPFVENDPLRPNEPYWQHIDWVVRRADSLGLYIGMVVGDNLVAQPGHAPQRLLRNPDIARKFGKWIGRRYRNDSNIVWILGGDQPGGGNEETWRALADGIAEGVAGRLDHRRVLMSYHPSGGRSSSEWFHNDTWLDFNMMQSGHKKDRDNYNMIARDYALRPVKPTMDDEPAYEGFVDDYDVRKKAYWAVFAGACGHTYGASGVYQFSQPDDQRGGMISELGVKPYWYEAINFPGASQVQYVRALIESRPMLIRIPDQSILVSDAGTGGDHVQATRAADGSYAFVYIPSRQPVVLDMSKISGDKVDAYWYDPRNGTCELFGRFPNTGTRRFTPPSGSPGEDWVLVLDDAGKNFPPPGEH